MEPYRLRRWNSASGRLFACARPGRSHGQHGRVSDDVVDRWVKGLPGPTGTVVLLLLGRRNNSSGASEFSYYSFYGGLDCGAERCGRRSFPQWLDRWHRKLAIEVVEHPTYDSARNGPEKMDAIAADLRRRLEEGRTVVLMDSGG